jgi:hypothetical protein
MFVGLSAILLLGCGGGLDLQGDPDGGEDGAVDTAVDTPPDAPTACPASVPAPGTTCTAAATCSYGTENCCGETHPSTVCSCMGGTWGCYATDACLGAPFMCDCVADADCEPDGWGRAWCDADTGGCVPCDNSGMVCDLWCEHGFVPPRNGCRPCECADAPCETIGEGYCTCDAGCGTPGLLCEVGLGRCVDDFCLRAMCPGPCDPLRGCLAGAECAASSDCRRIYSNCSCQAVPAADPRARLDDCDYDGGAACESNDCLTDDVQAVCADGICTERYGPGCGG